MIEQVYLAQVARCGLAALDNDIHALNAIIKEAERDGTVAELIASLASSLAGNAAHYEGIEGARQAFDNVIIKARIVDDMDNFEMPGS